MDVRICASSGAPFLVGLLNQGLGGALSSVGGRGSLTGDGSGVCGGDLGGDVGPALDGSARA